MIKLTRLNGTNISINPYLIEYIEETPDTIIFFQSGNKLIVKEKINEINEKISDLLAETIRKGINKSSLCLK